MCADEVRRGKMCRGWALLGGVALVAGLLSCADDEVAASAQGGTGANGGGGNGGGDVTVSAGGGGADLVQEDPYEAAPEPAPLSDAVVADLGVSIDAILSGVGGQTHSILIVGAETGQTVYERDADVVREPASNTKLFTSAAAMSMLGDQYRAETVVYATSMPVAGVIAGDLIVLGGHDFTWSTRFYADAQFPLQQIAEGLAAQGITQVTGTSQARGEFLYDGFNFGTYDAATERTVAAAELAGALSDVGIVTGGSTTSAALSPPAGAVELFRWRALPLDVGSSPINRISHNEFADILSRHLGWIAGGDSSYAAGEAEMIALLATGGEDVSGVVFEDGSGLSHNNRVSARHIVSLFELMHARPEGLPWQRTFSVAGVRGTISGRLTGPDTAGRFFGKTGTLSDTIALSGILEHAYDGQRYLFGMLMNSVTSSSVARTAHNQIVSAVASQLRAESDVPPSPVLLSVNNDGNGQSVTARWTPVAGADGYIVWRSTDGRVWPRSEARYVTPVGHRTLLLDASKTMYLRISAVRGIFESEPSDTYAARAGDAPSALLLVDGNDRWQADPSLENTLGAGHDFMARYAEVIDDRPFDMCANEAVVDGSCLLDGRAIVIWALGEESTEHVALDPEEQDLIRSHTASGGTIIISGAELGYQLAADMADLAFLEDVLRTGYLGDSADTFSVATSPGAVVSTAQVMSFFTPDRIVVTYPDQLQALGGSVPLLDYVGGAGGVAGVLYEGDYRAVTIGFPIESIDNRDDRRTLLAGLLAL